MGARTWSARWVLRSEVELAETFVFEVFFSWQHPTRLRRAARSSFASTCPTHVCGLLLQAGGPCSRGFEGVAPSIRELAPNTKPSITALPKQPRGAPLPTSGSIMSIYC